MNSNELLTIIAECRDEYRLVCRYCTSEARWNHARIIIQHLKNTPELKKYIVYNENRRSWDDRFYFNEKAIANLFTKQEECKVKTNIKDKISKQELLALINKCLYEYEKLTSTYDSSMRHYYADNIHSWICDVPEVRKYIQYDDNRRNYADKIYFDHEAIDKLSQRRRIFSGNKRDFIDGIDYTAFEVPGLYFVGETHFNPITNETFYWVKIGKAKDLKNRMASYNTSNPMLWRIDFADEEEYDNEEYYHAQLYEACINTCNHNNEWFMVDRDTYLAMCEQGFSYFD